MKKMRNTCVPMRDGVRLATDILLPDGPGPSPVVLTRTPYGKGWFSVPSPEAFVQAEYALVAQDCRGRFDSEGDWFPWVDDADDGYDTIEWIAEQPWSNGRVGMVGGSYQGTTQWAAASACPPHLVCIVPEEIPLDHYADLAYRGGALQLVTLYPWALLVEGKVRQQIPHDRMPELLRTLPLIEADQAAGRDLHYWRAWLEHPRYDEFWEPQNFRAALDRIPVPALSIDAWYDMYAAPTLDGFAGQRRGGGSPAARSGARAIIGPWKHARWCEGKGYRHVGDLDFGPEAELDTNEHLFRFLDRWLKEDDNGLDAEPPVWVFVMGRNQWRREWQWPLAGTQWRKLYLHSRGRANSSAGDGALSFEVPTDEPCDQFSYDPFDPVPTLGGNHSGDFGGTPAGPLDQRPVERRDDVLVYTTPPLEDGLEVVGPLSLHLAASSSAPDTDFTGKLVDVHPDGRAIVIAEGILRASYRESLREPSPVVPGKVYELTISLGATANCFLRGHCIRLEVSSSNFPRYSRNLNTGLDCGQTAEVVTAHQTVHHERGRESWIELPVVPMPSG